MSCESIELRYAISAPGQTDVEAVVREHISGLLQKLATDERARNLARKQGIDLDEFDRIRKSVSEADDRAVADSSLIETAPAGPGIEPGMVLLLVTIVPPVLQHVVAPVTVHVAKSIWDKFILPELQARFPRVEEQEEQEEKGKPKE